MYLYMFIILHVGVVVLRILQVGIGVGVIIGSSQLVMYLKGIFFSRDGKFFYCGENIEKIFQYTPSYRIDNKFSFLLALVIEMLMLSADGINT